MEITSLFGLPAHPLLVHLPVVLVPLALVGALGLIWAPWRERFGWATLVVLGAAGVFTQLAIGSGEALEEHVRETALVETHTDMGEQIRPWLLLFFVGVVAVVLLGRRLRTQAASRGASVAKLGGSAALVVTYTATVLLGAVSVYWIQKIGHSGAKATWEKTQLRIDAGGGGGATEGTGVDDDDG